MLCSSLAWRRHHNVDKILTEWRPPEAVLEYYSGGWHHYDKGDIKLSSVLCKILPFHQFEKDSI